MRTRTAVKAGNLLGQDSRAGGFNLRLLGGFNVENDAGPLALTATSSRLVAYLALQQRPKPRVTVAGVLWPESTQDKAQSNLRSTLWRVRSADAGIVLTQGTYLSLAEWVRTDISCLSDARLTDYDAPGSAVDTGIPMRWIGEVLLPDWDDEWVITERERFRLMSLHTLEAISARCVDVGDFVSAAEYALAGIRLAPLRESSHRALITAHVANGNTSEAIRQYENYRDLLYRELGVQPTGRIRGLMAETRG